MQYVVQPCPLMAQSRHRFSTLNMSAFGGKADIADSLLMSANDPKRTSPLHWREVFRYAQGCSRPISATTKSAKAPHVPRFGAKPAASCGNV